MSHSQAFVPPREFSRWIVQTRDLLKSIEKSGQVVNGAGRGSVSNTVAFAAMEITHGMLIMVGLSQGRTVAELREKMPAPVGWPDVP